MSRWISLALAATSTLALATVAAPASTQTPTVSPVTTGSQDTDHVTAAGSKRIGGGWCC